MEGTKIFFFLLFFCFFQAFSGFPERRTAEQHYAKFQETAEARSTKEGKARVFYPIEYGADPTGVEDSSDAILKAVEDAFSVQKGLELLPGINDLGGVVIDLQGGNYKISKPIRFPPSGGGNVVMQGGTLRASENFSSDEYLIELWSTSSKRKTKTYYMEALDFHENKVHKLDGMNTNNLNEMKASNLGVYYEDITFRDILFDSDFHGGGLLVIDSVRTRVDNCFFIHFTTDGILVKGGHETFISSTFLGQILTIGGDPRERNFSGVAIDLASNDNAITDVAIFSAATGVILRGQANMVTNVHCYNKATYWGGVGILVKLGGLGQTRIANSYMDYTGIVLEDPVQVHVTNAFFLGDANIMLKSIKGKISGLNIVDNMFSGSGWRTPIVALDESNGLFKNIDQVVIDRNNVLEMNLKSTIGQMTIANKGKKWVADFSSILVFPNRINHVQYSFYMHGGHNFVLHAITAIRNNRVVVEAKKNVHAVVSITVDQYARPGETNYLMQGWS